MTVAVVTDSTAYLPEGLAAERGITVVPLQVTMGDRTALEGVDLTPAEFARWITGAGRRATTSQPTPAAFEAAYDACGASEVVAVHLSAKLSGTASAAAAAAGDRTLRVVDSGQTGMGLGFAALAAADSAAKGGSIDEVAAAAEQAAARTRTLFYVDTLEYLRRGGRIGAAAALVGTALSVKPLLHIADGAIAPLEKVRTASKAIARLEELAVAEGGGGRVSVAVHHLASADRAAALADRLRARLDLDAFYVTEVGAVVGAHTGPGMLAVVVHRH
ncbi:MAG TPA: DegV family protein [Frankiaceae bacterium]|nr:DegV family protein [Frankiaceae bacterium]